MVDGKRYPNAKSNGLATIVEVDNEYYVAYKRFDVRTGLEVENELQMIQVDEILERQSLLQKELNGINEILLDYESLKTSKGQ